MKVKCPKCGTGKARRLCHREGNAEICSECCASIRDADCGDCVHYASASRYENNRSVFSSLPDGHFMMEINDAVSNAVNEALENAQRGKSGAAMAALTDMMRDHPRNHDVVYGIGVVHAIQGNLEESIQWFDKAIAIFPYSIESHYNKAVSYQKLLDVHNCIRSYQKVVEIGPSNDPEVAKARAFVDDMAASILKNEGIALDTYMKAAEKFNRAFELMVQSDWQGALTDFRASTALHDRSAPCHGNMGICHGRLGHKAEALAELDRALEIDPEYQLALSNREVFEKMEEGQPPENTIFQSVNYSLETIRKKRK